MERQERLFVALTKDGDRYVFLYDPDSELAVIETMIRFARDPELSFDLADLANLVATMRERQRSC